MDGLVIPAKIGKQNNDENLAKKMVEVYDESEYTALINVYKDLEEDGIMLGAGDYVDVEALKVAVDVMRDYQRIVYENERLKLENKLAFKERDELRKLIVENEMLKVPKMNITITKEQADKLGFNLE